MRPYGDVAYTLPSELRDIAYQSKRVVYDLLMKTAAETTLAIAPTGQARGLKAHDPERLARGLVSQPSQPCCTRGARHSPIIRTCI